MFTRSEDWRHARTTLEGVDWTKSCILSSLVFRVIHGTWKDVDWYVKRVFELPFGLRSNLVRSIMESTAPVSKASVAQQRDPSFTTQESILSIVKDWKAGLCTPDQLFSRINHLVAYGHIGLREAKEVTSLVLQEGGYEQTGFNPLEGRSQIKSAVCNLLEVDRIFCDSRSAQVFSSSGSFVELLPTQVRRSDIFFTSAKSMTSTASLWWEHVGDSDRLCFVNVNHSHPPWPMTVSGNPLYASSTRSTLLIGDYIRMQEMCVEVNQVIAVDVLSADLTAPILHFCILLEGAILPGNSMYGVNHFETEAYRDGATDLNSLNHRAHGSNSSANSDDEENQHSIPPQETQRQFVLVFVAVVDDIPSVLCTCALHELVLHDQTPTSVRYATSGVALVSGSNGLLGLVKMGADVESVDFTLSNAKGAQACSNQVKIHRGGARSTYSTYSMIEDTLLRDLPASHVRTHAGDAAITAVDVLRCEVSGVNQTILVSGDTNGVVCMWQLDAIKGTAGLRFEPYQVDSEARRIVSLHLSPSGAHVAVGLIDRLLLLNTPSPSSTLTSTSVTTSASSPNIFHALSSTSSSSLYSQQRGRASNKQGLHVRACLDMLCGTQARYGVYFHDDCLRIWRVVNEVRSPCVPGVSYKTELDSFADNDAESALDHNAAVNNHSNSNIPTRTATCAPSLLGQDLGTYSIDAEMSEAYPYISTDHTAEGLMVEEDPSSPRGGDSERDARSHCCNKGCTEATSYSPGISVTTWLHLNVDSFDTRFGTSLPEIEARLSPHLTPLTDKVQHSSIHEEHYHAQHKHREKDRSQLGAAIASTWQDVPTADSPHSALAAPDVTLPVLAPISLERFTHETTMMDLSPVGEPEPPWVIPNVDAPYATLQSLPLVLPSHTIRHAAYMPHTLNEMHSVASEGSDIAVQRVISSLHLHSSSTHTDTPPAGSNQSNGSSNSGHSGSSTRGSINPSNYDDSPVSDQEHMQYVEFNGQYMPLYAPIVTSSSQLLGLTPPTTTIHPTTPAGSESGAIHDSTPAATNTNYVNSNSANFNGDNTTTDQTFLSRAISGYEVVISEGVTSFRRAIDLSGIPAVPSFDLSQPALNNNNTNTASNGDQFSVHNDRYDARGVDNSVVLSHQARHSSHFSLYGMHRPFRSFHHSAATVATSVEHSKYMIAHFTHDTTDKFLRVKLILAVICSCYQPPTIGILAAALERPLGEVTVTLHHDLAHMVSIGAEDKKSIVNVRPELKSLFRWLSDESYSRVGAMFWIDPALGHNILCSLYLRYCGNKSVAVEHTWQDYLRTYGPTHLRHASRGLRLLTENIRKIDETANIRVHLPRQIGYIVGLYEIYARRVGLRGRIPAELGQLKNLRVLSMGNNHLCGELPASLGELRNLQRIVLHQNNLRGPVPPALGELGCIVNLAGNPLLHHGEDVPMNERLALMELYNATRGVSWSTKNYWCTSQPVAKWYKVGVLTSHVHSIVMSSNGMEGRLPASISQLSYLRMIELATMPGLVGALPKELCTLTTLRRLCICRCGLTGRIPAEIGRLTGLEELQLFGNQLTGSVPSSISLLTNLKLLSLGEYTGGNNFTSEPLPQCLSTLLNLEALFMANCNIKGPLPDWLGNLTELRQLDLQRNQLSGAVPPSIGRLQNLLYLNIKDNQSLSGRLPLTQLLSLSKLNRLSLVHCNFVDTDYAVEALKQHLPRCKVWI